MSDERKERLIRELNRIADAQEAATKAGKFADLERDHMDADDLLVAYIDDAEIAEAYERVGKWYA